MIALKIPKSYKKIFFQQNNSKWFLEVMRFHRKTLSDSEVMPIRIN